MDHTIKQERPCQNRLSALLFYIGFLLFFIFAIVLISSANITVSSEGDVGITDALRSDFITCYNDNNLESDTSSCFWGGRTAEEAADVAYSFSISSLLGDGNSLWDYFEQNVEVPITLILLVFFIGFGWISLLQRFSQPIVYATMLINAAGFVVIGIFYFKLGSSGGGIGCFAVAALILAFVYYRRQDFNLSARMISMACTALKASWQVWLVNTGIAIFYLLCLFIYTLGSIKSYFVFSVNETNCCYLTRSSSTSNLQTLMTILFLWTTYFIQGMKLITTSTTVIAWYFKNEHSDFANPSFVGLKWCLTKSAGVLAVGSFIMTLAQKIQDYASHRCWCIDPVACLMKVLLICIKTCIIAVTKFAIIAHVFTGEDFWSAASSGFDILKKNFGGAIITDVVGKKVLSLGAYLFSLAVGFIAWAWLDNVTGVNTLSSTDSQALLYVLIFFYVYLCSTPMPSIFLVAFTVDYLKWDTVIPFLGAVFVGSVAHLIFTFVADIVLCAVDTTVFCYILEKDAGIQTDGEREELLGQLPKVNTDGTTDAEHPPAEQQEQAAV